MNAAMLSADDRRKRRRIWFSGTAALSVLAVAAVLWAARHVPADIAGRTLSALQSAGLDPRAVVTVEGRTVTLSGEVPDAYIRARMRAIAGSVRGVREVRDQLTVAPLLAKPPTPAEPVPPPPAPAAPSTADRPAPTAAADTAPPVVRAEAITVSPSEPSPPAETAGPRAPRSAPPAPVYAAFGQSASEKPAASTEIPPVRPQLPLLHFAFGSARLTPESEPRLREIVEALRKRPQVRIELAGHADSVGPRSFNQRLSLQRARAVADRLAAAGIDAARLQTNGYSDGRPLMDNHTRQGRAMNRRVELILIQ